MGQGQIQVRAIQSKKDIDKLIRFPFHLYRDDPYWVPPLIQERRVFFDPEKNPFFDHADVQLFLAERDGEVVGTIAGIIIHSHNELHEERTGFWGIFEVIEDYSVAAELFSAAGNWVKAQGMDTLRGPADMSHNHEFGLLIDGFDSSPVILMTYNPPYQVDFVERFGFVKAKDYYAYFIDLRPYAEDVELPGRLTRVAERARKRAGVVIRKPNFKDVEKEIQTLYGVYNAAWRKNWGAIPITYDEAAHLIRGLKPLLDPDFIYIAEKDGKPVGITLNLLDFNQPLLHLNGRLFPFGWLKFWYYSKKIKMLRCFMTGVVEEYRSLGLDSMLYLETVKAAVKRRIASAEMSLILEDNDMMRRIIENLGGEIYKTYRMYDLPLNGEEDSTGQAEPQSDAGN